MTYVYVLASMFMQADMHEYVGMHMCTYVSRQTDIYIYIYIYAHPCAYIIYVCMHVHMYEGKNSYVYMHGGKHA